MSRKPAVYEKRGGGVNKNPRRFLNSYVEYKKLFFIFLAPCLYCGYYIAKNCIHIWLRMGSNWKFARRKKKNKEERRRRRSLNSLDCNIFADKKNFLLPE